MGYEVNVIIGQKVPQSVEEGKCYFRIIAEYDLCKVDLYDLGKTIHSKGASLLSRSDTIERTKIFYYEGDDKIDKDLYGDELIAFDPQLLLEVLIEKRKTDAYRRYSPLIALLEAMLPEFPEGFQVVLFGH